MVSWSNLEKLCSCSRTWMVSALACGNKWIQGGTYMQLLTSKYPLEYNFFVNYHDDNT